MGKQVDQFSPELWAQEQLRVMEEATLNNGLIDLDLLAAEEGRESEKVDFTTTPSESIRGVFVNSWGPPAGEPGGKVWVPDAEDCPDCKGKGVIELLTSVVPCKCRGG